MTETEDQDQDQAEPVGETLTTAALADAATTPRAPAEEARSFVEPAASQQPAAGAAADEKAAPLFSQQEANDLHAQWGGIQAGFVDEPRRAVEQADSLVATTMKRLAEMFAAERGKLEGQWDRGDDVSTEDLRQALRRYRSFFGRLLAI